MSNEIEYLAEEISKQNIEGGAWFLLTAYCKMQKERGELKKQLLRKKEPELDDLENSQPIHIAKNKKACFKENTNGTTRLSLDRAYGIT